MRGAVSPTIINAFNINGMLQQILSYWLDNNANIQLYFTFVRESRKAEYLLFHSFMSQLWLISYQQKSSTGNFGFLCPMRLKTSILVGMRID